MAHELKSPINAVESYLNLMEEKYLGENINNYLNIISRSKIRIQDMRKLIMDLLDLTQIEAGSRKRKVEKINLHDLFLNILELNIGLVQKRKIKIKYVIDKNITVNADKTDIEILINNLLSNAIKYNKDEGEVNFSIRKDENINEGDKKINKLYIKCADTGIGISEDDQQKLFNEFSRIKNEKTKNITGSGLGLSILKKILKHYNGHVSLESQIDFGSKFTLILEGEGM
ncbi:MAG: HAMP domain-containing histidine kinase [Oligoflexia bacterium]|nr:HAMP domain-containing histidine kinase [Oligoflexia bacterium]